MTHEKIPFVLNSNARVYSGPCVQKAVDEFVEQHRSKFESEKGTIARFLATDIKPQWLVKDEYIGGLASDDDTYKSGTVIMGRWRQHPYGGLMVRFQPDQTRLVLANRLDIENVGREPRHLDVPAMWGYEWCPVRNGEETLDTDGGREGRMVFVSLGISPPRLEIAKGMCRGFNKALEYYKTHDPIM